jgi:phage terminase large subunit-like protein
MSKRGNGSFERWRDDPAAFIEKYLINPKTDKPFELLPAERAFLSHMFQLGENGRLLYSDQIYAAIKKSGKTGFAAMIVIVTVLLFGGRYAEAFCIANDQQQAQDRVFENVRQIIEASPLLRNEARITAEKIIFPATGATIIALATDYASAAGAHPTIAVFDELWGFTSERFRRLWDELIPVPTQPISFRLVVSHAGFEGESALLQEMYERGLKLPQVGTDLYAGDGTLMFWSHVPIAPWQDDRWIADARRKLRPNQFLRMIENKFVSTESAFVSPAAWDNITDLKLNAVVSDPALPVFVGVDAGYKHDHTALVAVTTLDDSTQKVRLVTHRIFQPSPDQPLDFEAAIESTLQDWSKRFAIQRVLYDPWQMQATAQRLQRAGLPLKECPQTPAYLTAIGQNLFDLVMGGNIAVYHSDQIRNAVLAAVARETPRGWRLVKEKQSHKIDAVVALAMAAHAAVDRGYEEPMTFNVPIVFNPQTGDTLSIAPPPDRRVPEHYLKGPDEPWRAFVGPGGAIQSSPGWCPPGGWTPRKRW